MSFAALFVFLGVILGGVAANSSNCKLPRDFENGILRLIEYRGLRYLAVECDEGYVRQGDQFGVCEGDTWSVDFQSCVKDQENVCEHLKPPTYGKKQCSSNIAHIGSRCSFNCSRNYVLKGSQTRVCKGNLKWSGEHTSCELRGSTRHVPVGDSFVCEPPKAFENGNIREVPGRGVKLLEVECHEGYVLEGRRTVACHSWNELLSRCVKYQDTTPEDVDECLNGEHKCDQICHNTKESYRCSCNPGYQLVDHHTCTDIDECTKEESRPCQHYCHNTPGSFKCSCSPGYILVYDTKCKGCRKNSYWSGSDNMCIECPRHSYTETEGRTSLYDCKCYPGFVGDPSRNIPCQDIDECATDNFGCSHKCINTPGSVYCSCALGYELLSDNKTCADTNECEINNGGCQDLCINSIGSYSCSCGSGFIASKTNQYLCDDIDECAIQNGGCSDICVNFPGGHYCSCKNGYRLDSSEKNCRAITCSDVLTPHFSKKRCRTGSNKLRKGKNYPINSTCSFECFNGFKEDSKGYITCGEDGKWKGTIPKCIALSCPALTAPENGNVHPKSCLKGTAAVKEKCTYTCRPGYRIKSKTPVVRCLNNLTWSSLDEPTCIRIKRDPFISCPDDVSVELKPLENSTSINIPEPDTDFRDYDITPEWVSVRKPTIFPAGKTDVVFTVKNENKRTVTECILTVNVIDNEPPVFYQCPKSFEIQNANAYGVRVTWEEPIIFDNVGVESIESNLEPNSTLTPGVHMVEYIARDQAKNIATCSFEINVTIARCSEMDDPLNGQANCLDWMFGKICEPTCNEGYMRNPEEMYYMCNETGIWHPKDTISACLKFHDAKDSSCESGFWLLNNTERSVCLECSKEYASSTDLEMCK